MEEIIEPVSKELLKTELTEDRRLRMTNKSNSQVYIITCQNAPNAIREVGHLREIASRTAGGRTGLSMDIDECNTTERPYKQLIMWNPETEKILGSYRHSLGMDVRFNEAGALILTTSHVFHFSDAFIKEYLPRTTELGRSFVTLEYQPICAGSEGLFVLDNLWDGLGALTVVMPNVKCFFDEVTMCPSYHRRGRNMTLYFLRRHFNDQKELVISMELLILETSDEELRTLFCKDTFKEGYKILNTEIRKLGYNISPLVNAYMSLSPTMRIFGAAINYEFGDVEETGILIAVNETPEDERIRHIQMLIESHPDAPKTPCESKGAFTPKVVTPQGDCCHQFSGKDRV